MNPRDPTTYPQQRQHGNHTPSCGCFIGNHIWDEYGDKDEKWCVCCEHFYNTNVDAEFAAVEHAIEMNETISNKKPTPQNEVKPCVTSKGIIKRIT